MVTPANNWLYWPLIAVVLVACSPIVSNPTAQITNTPIPTETQPAPTVPPTLEASPTVEVQRPFYDVSNATLEHPIDPNCVDQFPQTVEAGKTNVLCFTFDNWVKGPVKLAGGYEMIIGAEGWIRQNGKDVPIVIPFATANRSRNELQVSGYGVRDFNSAYYEADQSFWEGRAHFQPGDTLWIIVAMPTSNLAQNSTQGFGFEATPYTEEELNQVLATGNFEILGNVLWPVIDIDGR